MQTVLQFCLVVFTHAQLSEGDKLLGLDVVPDLLCRTSQPLPGCRGDGLRFCRTSPNSPGGSPDWMLCSQFGGTNAAFSFGNFVRNSGLTNGETTMSNEGFASPGNNGFSSGTSDGSQGSTKSRSFNVNAVSPHQQLENICNCPTQCNGMPPFCVQRAQPFVTTTVPQRGLKLGFIGDTGASNGFQNVLNILRQENVDAVIHAGDMGYGEGRPAKWNSMISSALGDTPFVLTLGNHDLVDWSPIESYTAIYEHARAMGSCEGQPGVKMTCTLPGITIVTVSPGTMGTGHADYITGSFERFPNIWRICLFHKNMKLLNAGGKGDEAGYPVYEACRRSGAMVVNGHAHLYSRSMGMSSFETQRMNSHDPTTVNLQPGSSFVAVVGTGGIGTVPSRASSDRDPWWASVYGDASGRGHGCLICTYNQQDERTAHCEFKTTGNKVLDSFVLRTAVPASRSCVC